MPLKVVVVGAGIAGLAAAIGLACHGHEVVVYERRSQAHREDSGSGIQLQVNVIPILRRWGMFEDLLKVAVDNEKCNFRMHDSELIGQVEFTARGGAFFGLRKVLKDLFRDQAVKVGVKIVEGAKVERVDVQGPAIELQDGTTVTGDIIIGADGIGSRIRQELFPNFKPTVQDQACHQFTVPLETVQKDPTLRQILFDGVHNCVTVAPGRGLFTSPVPTLGLYDFQFIDHEFTLERDPNPTMRNERVLDLAPLRERWSDFNPAILNVLDHTEFAFKWRFTEVSGVPSWSSSDGKIILIGDAVHSMTPYTGQGSGMGIEDAAALSELLAVAAPGDDFIAIAAAFERLRRPRCEKVQKHAGAIGDVWALKNPEDIAKRNEAWRNLIVNDPEYLTAEADEDAEYTSAEFNRWLDKYDVFEAVREEMMRPRL